MSVLQTRIEEVSSILSAPTLSSDLIQKVLKQALIDIGVDDTDIGLKILEASTTIFGDFYEKLSEELKKYPLPKLQYAWGILKGSDKKEIKGFDPMFYSKPVGQWSDPDLLNAYERNCPSEIEEQLIKRTNGRPAIIFTKDGKVDIKNSLTLIRMARYQETPSTFMVDGELREVFKVGQFAIDLFYECPIHSNILLVEGYCEECGRVWDAKSYNLNVFIRLISENERNVDLRLYRERSFDELKSLFPKTFLVYQKLSDESKLPSMKRRISKSKDTDPFRVVHSQY